MSKSHLNEHVVELSYLRASEAKRLLMQDSINLVYVPQDIPLWLSEIEYTIKNLTKPYQFWLINEYIDTLEKKLADSLEENSFLFPNKISKLRFLKSVCSLVDLFVEITDDPCPFISLRIIDTSYFTLGKSSVSKHLHIDTTVLTLCCTYYGSSTEWVPNKNVIRENLKFKKMQAFNELDSYYMINPTNYYRTQEFSIALLKGEIRENEDADSLEFLTHFLQPDEVLPFNVGNGLLHRGPNVTHDECRLLLTISTMKKPNSI